MKNSYWNGVKQLLNSDQLLVFNDYDILSRLDFLTCKMETLILRVDGI